MNVQDATDYNMLMRWLLRLSIAPKISEHDARDASVRLADQAHKALRAGLDGVAIFAAWQEAPPHQASRRKPGRKPKKSGGKKSAGGESPR